MEIRGGQMVMFRGRGLETKPAVIPLTTQHTIPAVSYVYPLAPGQAYATGVYGGTKGHNFNFQTIQ